MVESEIKAEDINHEITCNWEIANNKRISDAFVIYNSVLKGEKTDINNIVSLDTCIHLVNSSSDGALEIKFKAPALFQLRKMCIISEARLIEIYGKHEEYLSTCRGEFFDEWEGMSVYIAEDDILHPTSECLLKFARLKKKKEMWLYGIKITLEKMESNLESSINFQNVNKILKESGHHLTDKAEKCRKFLQLYGSILDTTKSHLKGPDPQVLMKMFETEYLSQQNPISEKARIVSKCVADILPGFATSVKEKNGATDVNSFSSFNQSDLSKDEASVKVTYIAESLKNYINQQFVEHEKRIAMKMEERLNEFERKQNEKLDLIIKQLQELQSRLKAT